MRSCRLRLAARRAPDGLAPRARDKARVDLRDEDVGPLSEARERGPHRLGRCRFRAVDDDRESAELIVEHRRGPAPPPLGPPPSLAPPFPQRGPTAGALSRPPPARAGVGAAA